MESYTQYFPEDVVTERELPPCDLEHLEEVLLVLKSSHPVVRSRTVRDLALNDGAYIVKLLDLFDVCELDAEKPVLHRLFDIFYALVELCDRRVMEILLSNQNFLSVVGVFGYNPMLLHEMDFRSELEGKPGYKEVIPIKDASVVERVHMNFRIQVIKDNVLSRSLPDCSVIMLDHIVNENNYYILSYISDTDEYWQSIKGHLQDKSTRQDGLGLLKEIIQLVRVTRPLDKLPQQRRDGFGAPPVFGTLINNLFGDGAIFEEFSVVLGDPDSSLQDIELVLEIINMLVFFQGPERLRTFLGSEGKCITPPTSDKDRIAWKPGSSLFTALIYVFERYEATRAQMFSLLKEVFRVSLPQDDKFLNVMYPNYIHWMLQPLKHALDDSDTGLFALQDSIMELLTFCTEVHGYRIKYLFGRLPIAAYVDRMLRSRNKLFVIHGVKFIRACAARNEAFFSRFIIQHDLLSPLFDHLKNDTRKEGAVSSAILELLSLIEKSNLASLVEHIYTKFYTDHKEECPIVFEAIRKNYEDSTGSSSTEAEQREKLMFVQNSVMDEEEERYWEKDEPPETTFVPVSAKETLSEKELQDSTNTPKPLVDYPDNDEPISSLREGDLIGRLTPPPQQKPRDSTSPGDSEDVVMSDASEQVVKGDDVNELGNGVSKMGGGTGEDDEEEELKLPIREKNESANADSFLAAGRNGIKLPSKKSKSPVVKTMFEQVSWKLGGNASGSGKASTETTGKPTEDESSISSTATASHVGDEHTNGTRENGGTSADENGHEDESLPRVPSKRKSDVDEVHSPESLLKKAKAYTSVSSS